MNPNVDSDLYNLVTIKNIDSEDFVFTVNKEPYLIKAGETRNFPKFMVNIGLKHLIDKILLKKDPEGKLTRRVDLRDELAAQIIIEEVSYQKPVLPTDEELVQQINRPTDLDRVLQKNKEGLKANDTLIPPPVMTQPVPDLTSMPVEAPVTPITPEQETEHFDGLEEPSVPAMPTKAQLITYAQNTLKLTMDEKTKKAWDKMKVSELFVELGLDQEEDLAATGVFNGS